ncbi:uncharacterized protein LOC121876526 isoform X2 [Homarus americanus]|uniref:uncharacterized protein LOC121876526 isoform X2 n=1 Tax=Homarus americanus TaxID=6706 RepID=UPI001C46174D|nr:uncharacterized protein LOC121876526 isoform X2 [Homarus americanus]
MMRRAIVVVATMTALVVAAPSDTSGGSQRNAGGGRALDNLCIEDPPDCDGTGVGHLPVGQTLSYALQGWWNLVLDSDNHNPQESSRKVTLESYLSITRESQCRVKITLSHIVFSDWQRDEAELVETWVVVSGGSVLAVCGPRESGHQPGAQRDAHIHSLARSIMSATLNVAPLLDDQPLTLTESDHFGQCETRYHSGRVWPGGYEVVRTRDLTTCHTTSAGHFVTSSDLTGLTNKATLECYHQYQPIVGGELSLNKVMCSQDLSLPDAATFSSNLTLSLIDIQPQKLHFSDETMTIHELDLNRAVHPSTSVMDHTVKVHRLLSELCTELGQRVTLKAAVAYPHLLSEMKYLPKEMLVQLFTEVNTGKICSDHRRVRGVLSAAMRDSTSPNVAAAKCSLMTSEAVVSSPSWLSSLANVQHPSSESLLMCAGLLDDEHWRASVLGVTAMAGHAARVTCGGGGAAEHCHCGVDDSWGHEDEDRDWEVDQAVQVIIKKLMERLKSCSSEGDKQQALLAIRGLGNVGAFGSDVESALRECGSMANIDSAVRVAAFKALGQGPCSSQIMNWLKWEVLNETVETELRITAFQSLRSCDPNQAEAVAILITKKESDIQVKSYVSAFVTEEDTTRDVRQFSQHLVANLTALAGLPDTQLETDIVFQNSFLPRSVAFNLTSTLLKHFGGSVQFGGRLQNLEGVIQSVFGHKGTAGGTVEEWVLALIHKAHELFTSASKEFVRNHRRQKRSFSLSDVTELLSKVKHQVVTELHGWVFAGLGGQERYFSSFAVDPLALEWEELINNWLEQLLETTYSSLINSDVEMTTGWAGIDECIWSWSLLGMPLKFSQQEGGLMTLGASSQVNLLSLLTNPRASTLNIAVWPSLGVYSLSQIGVVSLTGDFTASSIAQVSAGVDVSSILTVQGADSMELKMDIPQGSFNGYLAQITRSFDYPSAVDGANDDDGNLYDGAAISGTDCSSEDGTADDFNVDGLDGQSQGSGSESVCNGALETALGISARTDTVWIQGRHKAVIKLRNYLRKSEESITGYRISFSWKNPGVNSMFLDIHIETEGSSTEKKVGVVFGLTYSPHFTLKLQFFSLQFSAFAETSLVNDPNLKRAEGHISFGNLVYGFKAELLFVEDGGHVSVKPRLVIAYPGQQEDALLEGYVVRYLSDKVRSVTLDLYTEGTLKKYLDITLKGTAEVKQAPNGDKVITLKNIYFSVPLFALGLEAAFSMKNNAFEGKVQLTWDGQVVMLDGSITSPGSGEDNQHFGVKFEMLLPDYPQLDTRVLSITQVNASEVINNLTVIVGPEATAREFQVIHSTSWRITQPKQSAVTRTEHWSSHYNGLATKIVNKLQVTSPTADMDWDVIYKVQVTDVSLENQIVAKINGQDHNITANFYDQSEELWKYHTELEVILAEWQFIYTDTTQQREEGDVVGQSIAVMPSGRTSTTSSRYFRKAEDDNVVFELSYEILIRDGPRTWEIVAEESFKWSPTHLNLQASVNEGGVTIFGLEICLEKLNSEGIYFHFKNWIKNLYESEVLLSNEDHKTNFNFALLMIPLNREITSKVALNHSECAGSVDGELAWDARGDASRTLTVSSALILPRDGTPLVLRFYFGSQLGFFVGENYLTLLTSFVVHMPSGATHKLTVNASGLLTGHKVADVSLNFTVESPFSEDIEFHLHFINQEANGRSDIGLMVRTYSEASYWELLDVKASGVRDGTTITIEVEGNLGNDTLNLDATGSYRLVESEHQVMGSAELRIPSSISWKQLKSSLDGTFSVGHSPGRLKVTHLMIIEKNYQEIFNCNGDVMVHVPKVEGHLTFTHAGSIGTSHIYTLQGTFTGKELELHIEGTIDEVPLKISLHYIDGRQVTVLAMYQEEGYLSLSVTTELKDISIGIRKGNGTSYSLTTVGQLLYQDQRTKMHHHLSITPSEASSVLRLSPFFGKVFMLTTNRTKIALDHWHTDVSLNWEERTFIYHDEVNFPSFTDWFVKVEVNAPDLYINDVMVELESLGETSGEHAVQMKFQEENVTVHSARLMFYKYDAADEKIWRAGARNVIFSSKEYSDLIVSHAMMLPFDGMEIKSNLTVGETPIIGVGVKVTPQTRAVILSVCTTSDECVRLRVHTHAQTTPSTRTFSMAVHALNSLFWQGQDDPLLQNSITFMAKETTEKVTVSGGIRRVECERVTCSNFRTRGLLHATLHVMDDALDLLLDTTNRTIKLRTVVYEGPREELAPATLPGGRLVNTSTVETNLWLDRDSDPEGMISWTCTIAHYASSRASEWVIQSSLHHQSFNKVLRVSGNINADPTSASAVLLLDVFTTTEDSLRVDLKLLQEHGSYIFVGNLTRDMDNNSNIMGVIVSFLPSPDSGEVSVVLVVPSTSATTPKVTRPKTTLDTRFTLTCGMDVRNKHTVLSCKFMTPSVHEKVFFRYQPSDVPGCLGFMALVGIFNHTYYTHQKMCTSPTSLQATLSKKTQEGMKELALKFGLVDVQKAEIDLLDTVHIRFQLHPPFLLHAMAHSGGSMWDRLGDIMDKVHEEVTTLILAAKTAMRVVASDLRVMDGLSQISTSTPTSTLAEYISNHTHHILLEFKGDQLLLDMAHGAQLCFDVTSVLIEATAAYLSHNFGQIFTNLAVGAEVWFEAVLMNSGTWLIHLGQSLSDIFTSTTSFIISFPELLLDYASTIPVLGNVTQWIVTRVRWFYNSTVFAFMKDIVVSTGHYLHKVLSLLYSEDENYYDKETSTGAWNIWVPLPRCGHTLFDVWYYVTSSSPTSQHQVSLYSAFLWWCHLLSHPTQLIHYLTPPFTAQGAIIGSTNFVSLDGQTYSLSSSCAHVLVTDAEGGTFTLISDWDETNTGRDYTLLFGDIVLKVQSNLQVTIGDTAITLPYIRRNIRVMRDLHHLVVKTKDSLGRDVVTLTCWVSYQACIVSVSGWFHADTLGLLGNLNLEPADDLTRPSGKVALSGEVFSHSWRVSSHCPPERAEIETPHDVRAQHLCDKFLHHYTSPVFSCHDAADIMPFYDTCMKHLASLHNGGNWTETKLHVDITKGVVADTRNTRDNIVRNSTDDSTSKARETDENRSTSINYNTTDQISVRDVLFPITKHKDALIDATIEEVAAVCDVLAAYSTVCGERDVRLPLPFICGQENQLTFKEPLSPVPQLDLVLLINEEKCDSFMYQHLIRPLPPVLERIAQGKNISDIQIGVMGYGSGGGDVIYHASGTSLLTPVSQFKIIQPRNKQHPRASLLQGLKAISTFPFRPGSVRVAFIVRCDDYDLPRFTESLPKEMGRRRLALFTLTPELLVFNPSRPKAVRNTIGVDRWRVYNLRLEKQESSDSWGIRRPNSNIAQLAMKSGGGVFSVTALKEDNRAPYFMKLFRRVLSRAIIKVINVAYRPPRTLSYN